jgi:hypothetical protein
MTRLLRILWMTVEYWATMSRFARLGPVGALMPTSAIRRPVSLFPGELAVCSAANAISSAAQQLRHYRFGNIRTKPSFS